ncbi:Conserved domain protein = CCUG 46377 [Desulfitobacterium hafniense]|uniref:Conserved domain protein = CCUG 46377 n=1 Tax=Desulfitobacterium hafniense TaxID=49338 RepID=A0A098B510_DESHA|nr:AAA family ATPase [Desulfitobacterium hafniense]CDX03465.1 Conserved domain protein = CCUG 46377 [Desulfitobacterium hafniense]
MATKIPSVIEKIVLNNATYCNEVISPTFINFFFGNNGTGKSTIAKNIRANDGITWLSGKIDRDYTVLVYDQEFITANIQSYGKMPGVFTISEVNIEIQNQIQAKSEEKEKIDERYGELNTEKGKKENEQTTLLTTFQDSCWNKTRKLREGFEATQAGKKRKQSFAETVLAIKNPRHHDLKSLKKLYETAFDPGARVYNSFDAAHDTAVLDDLPGHDILGQAIISSNDTPFANFIKALNATDWVRQGHEQFSDGAEGKCPYCQQMLPEDFEDQIAACFDQRYQQNIQRLREYYETYKQEANRLFSTLQKTPEDVYPKINTTLLKDKLSLLYKTIEMNLNKIKGKIAEPAMTVTLDKTKDLLDEINTIISEFNKDIAENNAVVNAKQQKQAECRTKVWELIAHTLKDEVSSYNTSNRNLVEEIADLAIEINKSHKSSMALHNEMANLSRQVVNTKATVDSINTLLRDSGFQGFSIREKAKLQSVYEVVRPDGTIADNLSEGERNFIAFLYFYHLVKGSESADGGLKNKVVVIDDPVSSMDSNSLFIVSALTREMIEICHNNVDYENGPGQPDFIKQIFILTHNAYFHREITYNQVSKYLCVSFFLINKADNISTIRLCERRNDDIPTEMENYNPVQNSYAALWDEYRELTTTIPLLNVVRRILEYYFLQLCGYDGTDIRQRILKDNKDKFVVTDAEGKDDYTQYHVAAAMLSYISAAATGINDGMNYVDGCMEAEECRRTFEMIFELMNQGQHYKMMMGN